MGLPSHCRSAIGVGWPSCHRAASPWDCTHVMGLPSAWDVWHIVGLPMTRSCHQHGAVIVLWSCHQRGSAISVGLSSSRGLAVTSQANHPTALLFCSPTRPHCKHMAVLCNVFEAPGFQSPPVFEFCSDDGCCSFCSPSPRNCHHGSVRVGNARWVCESRSNATPHVLILSNTLDQKWRKKELQLILPSRLPAVLTRHPAI